MTGLPSGIKCLFKIFLILLFVNEANGQESFKHKDKNSLFYELGGTGYGPISIHYERKMFMGERIIFAPGVGLSFTQILHIGGTKNLNNWQLFIPWQTNFLYGKGKHYFEFGFGMPLSIDDYDFRFVGNIYVLRLGYRFLFHSFLIRASINPTIIVYMPSIMGGIAIGYSF